MKRIWLAVLFYLEIVCGQRNFIDEIQRLYSQQGIPFREDKFLDNLPILPEYDFVIVGSGPAGSVIANRLSEIPDWKVLLIETGLEGNIYNDLPFINAFLVLGNLSRMYDVERDPNVCLGLVDKRCHWPAGNGVGGATLINGMLYTRGHPTDYDIWELLGNLGWSFKEVLPYFLKSENMSVDSLASSKYHSRNGPLHIDYPFQTKLGKLFLQAGKELGYQIIDHNNPETPEGFTKSQITTKRGRRFSAASAFLLPVRSRKNLHIVKNAFATRVIIDPGTRRAYGVRFMKRDEERTVLARREVILSAGAFGSPQLLMLSGVGPAEDLWKLQIPVIVNLPVGKNLQEHLGTPAMMFLINTTDSYNSRKILPTSTVDYYKWLNGVKNIYTNNGAESMAYVKTKYADGKPDIELIFSPTSLTNDGGAHVRRTLGITEKVYGKTWGKYNFAEAFTILPMMMYPRSRGELKLRSRNPRDPPIIRGNFFQHPFDMKVLVEGVRAAARVANTAAFQQVGARLHRVPVAGCEEWTFDSYDYWDCAVRTVPVQFHHQSGTCSMGPDPRSSVVDPRLRVHGISGLRVADASIMPVLPGVHTMAPCYMIGEKAADMIKQDWGVF